jgi:hypothetical protein
MIPDVEAAAPLEGSRFYDQSRFRSSQITRAFVSVTRAASEGPHSDVPGPADVSLAPDVAMSEAEIVRGVD